MILHVQQRFPGTYYAPRRWRTRDGCMPYHVLLAYWHSMWSGYAMERLHLARAVALSRGNSEDWQREQIAAFGGRDG